MVRFGVAVAVVEVLLYRCFEVVDAVENTPPDTFFGNVPEEPLDEVDPRGRGRREVQVEPFGCRASQSFTSACLCVA